MIAMEMGYSDDMDGTGSDTGKGKLPLDSLARIEQKSYSIPPQQIRILIALSRWNLAAGAQGNEFAGAHNTSSARFSQYNDWINASKAPALSRR